MERWINGSMFFRFLMEIGLETIKTECFYKMESRLFAFIYMYILYKKHFIREGLVFLSY